MDGAFWRATGAGLERTRFMRDWSMSASTDSVSEQDRAWSAETSLTGFSSLPNPLGTENDRIEPTSAQLRWNLAFAALMFYAFIEYSRLPEMYPAFAVLKLGKVSIVLAALGYLVSPRTRTSGRLASGGFDLTILVFIISSFVSACFSSGQQYVWDGFVDVLGGA